MLPMEKSKKNLAAFSFEDKLFWGFFLGCFWGGGEFFFLVNREFIGMIVPQGDRTAAEESWSVTGVLWQFSIHSGISHDCWEMNSSPHCKFDFLNSS